MRIAVVIDLTRNSTTYQSSIGSRSHNFLWKWSAPHRGMIFLHFIINILQHRACHFVTLVQSYRIICKFEFQNTFGKLLQNCLNNYNPFLTPCKSYRLWNRWGINRKTLKTRYKPEKSTFIAHISYNLLPFRLTTVMISLETVYNFVFLYLLAPFFS